MDNFVDQQLSKYEAVEAEMFAKMDQMTYEIMQESGLPPYAHVPVKAAAAFIGNMLRYEDAPITDKESEVMEKVTEDIHKVLNNYVAQNNLQDSVILEALPYLIHSYMAVGLAEAIYGEVTQSN